VPGCFVPSGDLVDDRASYRFVLVAVLVCEAAAYCLRGVDVLHLFALSLYVALVWLVLLVLLWLWWLVVSTRRVLHRRGRRCRRLEL